MHLIGLFVSIFMVAGCGNTDNVVKNNKRREIPNNAHTLAVGTVIKLGPKEIEVVGVSQDGNTVEVELKIGRHLGGTFTSRSLLLVDNFGQTYPASRVAMPAESL